jgi:hypothetical protein
LLGPDALAGVPPKARGQRPGANSDADGFSYPASAGLDAGTGDVLLQVDVQRLETFSAEEENPGRPRSGQAAEVLTAAPSESRTGSADERAAPDEHAGTWGSSGGWTRLLEVVSVVVLPMLGGCWVSRAWRRRSTQGTCPE